jgi:Zn-finger nucleic acid-binding protein
MKGTGMLCPIDQSELVITDRQGVEIDYCPKCRGIWLDRGELDKIIDRGAAYERRDDDDDDWDDRRSAQEHGARGYESTQRPPQRKKKRSFLSEMFDFD